MARKWLFLLVIVSVLIVVVAGCAPAAAPPTPAPPAVKPPVVKPAPAQPPVERIVWKNAQYGAPPVLSYPQIKWFFDEVVKRSEGRFEMQYFWSASLSPAKEQPDGLKTGLFEATSFVPAYYPSKLPLYNIGYLPSIFPLKDNKEDWRTLFAILKEWEQTPPLKEEFAKWNAMAICETYPPVYTIMGKVRIATLADIKGRKIRAVGGTADLLTKAGAAVVYTTAPEMYDALNKGVIEGLTHTFGRFHSGKIYEISKYYTPGISLGHIPFAMVVSIKDYEALPADMKKVFQEVNKDFTDVLVDGWDAARSEAFEAFEKKGIEFVEFSAADNEKLRDMAKGVWGAYMDKLEKQGLPGKEVFNSLQDIIKKHIPSHTPRHL